MQPEQNKSWWAWCRESADKQRARRSQRNHEPPWMLKNCPESSRHVLVAMFTLVGIFSEIVFYLAAVCGFIVVPLFLATVDGRTVFEAGSRHYVHWLKQHTSPQNFPITYLLVQMCLFVVLLFFQNVFRWISRQRLAEKLKREMNDASRPVPGQ